MHRTQDAADGRFTLARLTDAGHDQVVTATPAHQALVGRLVFDALSDRQVRQLGEISRRLADAAGPSPAWRPSSPTRGDGR